MNTGIERDSIMAVLESKRVWLVHVIANALLFAAFFYWLQIKEETGASFALAVIGALVIVFCALLLHGATFDFFRQDSASSFTAAMRRVLPRLPWLLLWAVAFGAVLWLIAQLWDYDAQAGGWARHVLPEFLRRRVSPRSMISASSNLVWFVFFFVAPILFLPFGARIASCGLRGIFSAAAWRPIRDWRFWIVYAVCFLIGAYCPYKLAYMTPTKATPLSAQTWSMAIRLGFGYLLFVTMWLIVSAAITHATADPKCEQELAPVP